MKRISSVTLILLVLFLTACQQSEAPDLSDLGLEVDPSTLITTPISIDYSWISVNPNGRWTIVGTEMQPSGEFGTRIQFRLNNKAEQEQDFEEALSGITAETLDFATLENGSRYARTSNDEGIRIIYRDYPDVVVEIRIIDTIDDVVDQTYIEDWEMIALEGNLFLME